MPRKKGKHFYRHHGLSLRKGQHNPNRLAEENRQKNYSRLADKENEVNQIFAGWTKLNSASTYIYMDNDLRVRYTIALKDDSSWEARHYDNPLPASIVSQLPTELTCKADYQKLHDTIMGCVACQGLDGFVSLELLERDEFTKREGIYFHNDCEKTVLKRGKLQRCVICHKKRDVLRMRLKRLSTQPSSRTALAKLSRQDLELQAKKLAAQKRAKDQQILRLKKKLETLQNQTIELPTENKNIEELVVTSLKTNKAPVFEDEAKNLLWEQQIKQANCSNAKGMKWHPTIIRWALTIRSMSKSTFNYIRDSGLLSLPSTRTLDSYTAYRKIDYGIDHQGIDQLSKLLGDDRDISLVHDEIKIKEQLVYEKHSGRLIGYVEVGDINQFSREETDTEKTATHVMCFMARSLKTRTAIPVANYASRTMTADQIYNSFWDIVMYLEMCNIRVRCSISDGASTNRSFHEMHRSDIHCPSEPVHFTPNIYAEQERNIYFISDVPHLLKTTRNCMENSHGNMNTRNLMLNGLPIKWSHISTLFDELSSHNSFTRLHKLTREHVKLTSYARMRVNLAAQVLSQSVANALRLKRQPQLASTITFIEKFNKAFDLLNVRFWEEGKKSRNPNKNSYCFPDDCRFEWLEKDFIGWLDAWRDEVLEVPNLEKSDVAKAQISLKTIQGWKIASRSFIALTKELLAEGYKFILSEKLVCQDVLEQHFAHQRQCGGANSTPTCSQYLSNEKTLSVTRDMQLPSKRGNCRGGVTSKQLPNRIDNTPLRKQ